MKCQEIFKTLNLIWNNLDTRNNGRDLSSDDSVKFRKLMQIVLVKEEAKKLSSTSIKLELVDFLPLIHNDAIRGSPYNPESDQLYLWTRQRVLPVNIQNLTNTLGK